MTNHGIIRLQNQTLKSGEMKKHIKWIIPLAVLVLLAAVFFIYTGQYYHADERAYHVLVSNETVKVFKTDYGYFFDGPSEEDAFIFYPGAKVEETAYAPLCRELADAGLDVCLVKMPFHLAFFGMNAAEGIMEEYDYTHWYIGGNSLGGAIAASFAAKHTEGLDGLILLAAYSATMQSDTLTTLLIYGSEDTVLNHEKYQESLKNLPGVYSEYVIEGGNHAQFGSYGPQKGDGTALIPAEQQIDETVRAILAFITR